MEWGETVVRKLLFPEAAALDEDRGRPGELRSTTRRTPPSSLRRSSQIRVESLLVVLLCVLLKLRVHLP